MDWIGKHWYRLSNISVYVDTFPYNGYKYYDLLRIWMYFYSISTSVCGFFHNDIITSRHTAPVHVLSWELFSVSAVMVMQSRRPALTPPQTWWDGVMASGCLFPTAPPKENPLPQWTASCTFQGPSVCVWGQFQRKYQSWSKTPPLFSMSPLPKKIHCLFAGFPVSMTFLTPKNIRNISSVTF